MYDTLTKKQAHLAKLLGIASTLHQMDEIQLSLSVLQTAYALLETEN